MPTQTAQLGWIRSNPDIRDQPYAPPADIWGTLPQQIDLTPPFPCYDQAQIGSCTANALAGAVQYDRLKSGMSPDFIPSRLFIYYNERVLDRDVGTDSGSTLRSGLKTLQQQGVCPETDWPYIPTQPLSDGGAFPPGSKPATNPPQSCYDEAVEHTIISYQSIPQNLGYFQACLAATGPFVFGFTIYHSWYDTKPTQIPYPSGNDSVVGGHAVMCVGYDNSTGMFKIRNSWGTGVGENGYFYMPYAYLTESNLASDFWVIQTVKG